MPEIFAETGGDSFLAEEGELGEGGDVLGMGLGSGSNFDGKRRRELRGIGAYIKCPRQGVYDLVCTDVVVKEYSCAMFSYFFGYWLGHRYCSSDGSKGGARIQRISDENICSVLELHR